LNRRHASQVGPAAGCLLHVFLSLSFVLFCVLYFCMCVSESWVLGCFLSLWTFVCRLRSSSSTCFVRSVADFHHFLKFFVFWIVFYRYLSFCFLGLKPFSFVGCLCHPRKRPT
jgi:hypothetical protein